MKILITICSVLLLVSVYLLCTEPFAWKYAFIVFSQVLTLTALIINFLDKKKKD